MDISLNTDSDTGYIVRLGSCAVTFRCETAAGQFVERLRQRLAATHVLPALSWEETQGAAEDSAD